MGLPADSLAIAGDSVRQTHFRATGIACDESSAGSANIAAFDAPADDQPVKLSKAEVDLAALNAQWMKRYTDADDLINGLFGNQMALAGDLSVPWARVFPEFQKKFSQAVPTNPLFVGQ